MALNFTSDYIAQMRQLGLERGKYFAIAQLRQQHGLSLFEADQLMTAWMQGSGAAPANAAPPPAGQVSDEDALRGVALPLVQAGRIIEAIKRVREESGWGLKEAKDFVDQLRMDPAKAAIGFGGDVNLTRLVEAVAPELRRNNKIQAIKIVREHTGFGLKEAKDYVEALAEALARGEAPPPLPPGARRIVPAVAPAPPIPPPLPPAPEPQAPPSAAPPPVESKPSLLDDPPKPSWLAQSQDSTYKPADIYQSKSLLKPEARGYLDSPPDSPILDSPEAPPPLESFEPPPAPDLDDGKPSTQEVLEEWYRKHEAANANRSISEPPQKKGCLVMFVLGGAAIAGAVIAAAALFTA